MTSPQCGHCAFLLVEDQSSPENAKRVEEKYKVIRGAKNAPRKPRRVLASDTGDHDKTETCAANSKNWLNKSKEDEYCKDFIDGNLSLSEALSLRESQISNQASRKSNILALFGILATVFVSFAIYIKWEALLGWLHRMFLIQP